MSSRTVVLVVALLPLLGSPQEPPARLFAPPPAARAGVLDGPGIPVAVSVEPLLAGSPLLALDLPDGRSLVARLDRVRRPAPGSATWVGRIEGQPGSTVILTVRDGIAAGTIHARGGEYQVLPAADGEGHVLERIEHGPDAICATEPTPGGLRLDARGPVGGRAGRADRAGPIVWLDVLVLYSPDALKRYRNHARVRAVLEHYVDAANEAFAASEIPARLRAVGVRLSPMEEITRGSPLERFAANREIRELRDALGADLVHLAHDGPEACGRAEVLQSLQRLDGSLAHSTMKVDCGARTFVHEVGHNLGFQHDPEWGGTDWASVSDDSYGHWRDDAFRTIMANSWCGCDSILQFSNPNLRYAGHATGILGARDNARVGGVTAPLISDYRRSRIVFSDDFESGDLALWPVARGRLDVEIAGNGDGAALTVALDGSRRPAYVMHRIPADRTQLDVDLTLDLGDATLGDDEADVLMLRHRNRVHAWLTLRREGDLVLALYTLDDTGREVKVAETPLRARGTEAIRVQWRRASTASAGDGSVALYRANREIGMLGELANGARDVTQVRLGLPRGGAPGAGVLRIDDYRAAEPPALADTDTGAQ